MKWDLRCDPVVSCLVSDALTGIPRFLCKVGFSRLIRTVEAMVMHREFIEKEFVSDRFISGQSF